MARREKVVSFTSSTKLGSSDNSESSKSTTPSPISKHLRSSKTTHATNGSISKGHKPPITADKGRIASKRKRDPTTDTQHYIVTRSRSDPSEVPNLKRPRRGQNRGQGPVIYSERWHPMDDILSPKRAAKVKAMCGKTPDQSDTDESGEEQASDTQDTEEESSEDQELSQASDHAPSPGCRRSSRKLSNTNIPNYDTKFHPTFDRALRPASAQAALVRKAKRHTSRRLSTETSTAPSEDEGMTTDVDSKAAEEASSTTASPVKKPSFSEVLSVSIPSLQPKSAVKSSLFLAISMRKAPSELPSPPPSSNLRNPHLGKILDYNELGQFDQLIYSLQKGAPVYGNTLPLSWQTVKQALFNCGNITLDELNSEDATKWLKLRYECLRLGIEAFFKSKSEIAWKNDWTLFQYEGFDAFDKEPGRKYWKHHRHSIFSPTTTTINANHHELMEVPETDDEKKGRRGQKGPTTYNHVTALEDQPTIPTIDHSKLGGCSIDNGGPEEARNHVDEGESQEQKTQVIDLEDWMDENSTLVETMHGEEVKTPIIDLEDWRDEDDTLVETMHEEVVSSEGLMSREELGKIIADFVDGPFSTRHDAKVNIPSESIANSNQPVNHHRTPNNGAPTSPYATRPSSALPPSRGFQATNKTMQGHLPNEAIPLPIKRPKSKKRKAPPEHSTSVSVHEDTPGGTPRITHMIANNPPSPGTDIPKENLRHENEAEHSSQVSDSVRTPQAPRFRRWGTAASTPFRSLFGGPAGPRSSPSM